MATIKRDILLYNCITAKAANAQERRSRIVCRVVGHGTTDDFEGKLSFSFGGFRRSKISEIHT